MQRCSNDAFLDVFSLLDRDNLDSVKTSSKRFLNIVVKRLHNVCLRRLNSAYINGDHHTFLGINYVPNVYTVKARRFQGGAENKITFDAGEDFDAAARHFASVIKHSWAYISDCIVTPSFNSAVNEVSSTVGVSKFSLYFIGFAVDFRTFHELLLGFAALKEDGIWAPFADCCNEDLLAGLAKKGMDTFELHAVNDDSFGPNRPPCNVTVDGLLEFCFGEDAVRMNTDRKIQLEKMQAPNDLFAIIIQASRTTMHGKDVEMDIDTATRVLLLFPPELQQAPVFDSYIDSNVYDYSFVDGRPRKVIVKLSFHEIFGYEYVGSGENRRHRRRGVLHRDKLIITFT